MSCGSACSCQDYIGSWVLVVRYYTKLISTHHIQFILLCLYSIWLVWIQREKYCDNFITQAINFHFYDSHVSAVYKFSYKMIWYKLFIFLVYLFCYRRTMKILYKKSIQIRCWSLCRNNFFPWRSEEHFVFFFAKQSWKMQKWCLYVYMYVNKTNSDFWMALAIIAFNICIKKIGNQWENISAFILRYVDEYIEWNKRYQKKKINE